MSKRKHLNMIQVLAISLLTMIGASAFSQTKIQTAFVSPIDQDLSIKTVVVAPFTDNQSGIYSVPLTEEARNWLAADTRWNSGGNIGTAKPDGLADRPADIQKILQASKAQAVLTGRITRESTGLILRMTLSVGSTGLPLVVEEAVEPRRFDIDRMKQVLRESLVRLRDKLPYNGVLLSRRGQQVTLNLGTRDGIKTGEELSVIQILTVKRHPKKHFLIGAEKEILGKVNIFKADESLSFGSVVVEKETGVLTTGMKVLRNDSVAYPTPTMTADGELLQDLGARKDGDVFGDKPVEWLPEPDPQYGRVQVFAGLGQYSQTANLSVAGSTSGATSLAPNLAVAVEGWINAEWFVGFDLRQSAFSVQNTLANSSPSNLNVSLSRYAVSFGHNFLLGQDFFGPRLQLSLGSGTFNSRVDSSTPALFSNMSYGGMFVGFLFNTPVDPNSPWDMGARFRYSFNPSVTESLSSGSAGSVSISDFGFLIGRKVRKNFRYVGELDIEYYNSDFNGPGDRTADPVSNISHRSTTLLLGLEYSF